MKKVLFLCFITFNLNIFGQVKITCNEVKPTNKPLPVVSYVKALEKSIGGSFEACEYNKRDELIVETEIHPFISALYHAYADHRPISISPDMIWLLICQGFTTHVHQNSKTLKDKFVTFDGKKKISIRTEPISLSFKKGSELTPWPKAFPVLSDSISKYVKNDFHQLFVQSFSTTTLVEKAAFEVAFSDVMSDYFEYEYATACGIPEITIEGTKEDWQKIYDNLSKFKGYEINNWIVVLKPIMQQFINASENKIDKDFLENIFKEKDESGGPFITGWITKFFPYIVVGENKFDKNPYLEVEPEMFGGLTTNDFTKGISKIDFNWNYFDEEYKMQLYAGFVGITQDEKSLTLRPEIGWIVSEKVDDNKIYYSYNNWKTYIIILLSVFLLVIIFLRLKKR